MKSSGVTRSLLNKNVSEDVVLVLNLSLNEAVYAPCTPTLEAKI
jgi:hypothetical protein